MEIKIQHNAADRSFFVQDSISDNEYREYIESFSVACVEAVRAAYPDAEIVSEIDWNEVASESKYISASDDDVAEHVEQIIQRVWDKQAFCSHSDQGLTSRSQSTVYPPPFGAAFL